MPDETRWIVVRDGMEPYEVKQDHLESELKANGPCIHLVPLHIWKDFQKTSEMLKTIRSELRTYRRAGFVVQASLEGFPMPPKEKQDV